MLCNWLQLVFELFVITKNKRILLHIRQKYTHFFEKNSGFKSEFMQKKFRQSFQLPE